MILFDAAGQDNVQPATLLRSPQTRSGSQPKTMREVKPRGAPDTDFRQRDQSLRTRRP